MEELEEVIFGMKDDKSPRLDGFQANFFKASWVVIKEGLLRSCEESRTMGKVLGNMNSTFIILIPKEKNLDSQRVQNNFTMQCMLQNHFKADGEQVEEDSSRDDLGKTMRFFSWITNSR
eukprot:Gb_28441 [translate_table: standard]